MSWHVSLPGTIGTVDLGLLSLVCSMSWITPLLFTEHPVSCEGCHASLLARRGAGPWCWCQPLLPGLQDAEEGTYDAIIVDSSDPVGPAEVLFQKVLPASPFGVLACMLKGCMYAFSHTWSCPAPQDFPHTLPWGCLHRG